MLTKSDKDWIKNNFAMKHELSALGEKMELKAKERHSELLNLFDGLAKEVKDNEEFRLVTNHRLGRVEKLVGVTS